MEIIKTIKDSDLGFNSPVPEKYEERVAVRIILLDEDNKVAFLQSKKYSYFKIPGGGVEEGEEILQTLKRESLEETGCHIKDINELGIIDEWRDQKKLHQLSYCYIVHLDGEKGKPNFIGYELEHEYRIIWLDIDYALSELKKVLPSEERYEGRYGVTRDIFCLEETKKF